ncbi:hypothetical protein AB0K40_02225 [Nonomuraea bangladeshensis]|uniref:Uncharacterized protein n=1 Tax=Nonomuraea bangladeshensis TaxID=404385 RepID=A0ABV3GVK9_9ACTN
MISEQMWSGMILLGLVGIALPTAFRAVEARLPRWYTGLPTAQRGR